jgi:hypothetical protein
MIYLIPVQATDPEILTESDVCLHVLLYLELCIANKFATFSQTFCDNIRKLRKKLSKLFSTSSIKICTLHQI